MSEFAMLFRRYLSCHRAGKYCKIFDPMFVQRNWQNITDSLITQYEFPAQNNQFLGQR